MVTICESCLDNVYEDYPEADKATATQLILMIGEELPDHLCDKEESDGDILCKCPAH